VWESNAEIVKSPALPKKEKKDLQRRYKYRNEKKKENLKCRYLQKKGNEYP